MKRWRNAGESTGVHAGTETPPYVKGPAKKLAETLAENITNKARARVVDEMVSRYDAYIDKMKVYYTDDPSIPSFIKRLIKGLWDSITPHFRSEVGPWAGAVDFYGIMHDGNAERDAFPT